MSTNFPPGRILLIDDSKVVLQVLSNGLKPLGWDVQLVTTGAAAFEAVRSSPPEVVVCDLHLEEMTGFEVLAGVHAIHPSMPVIILSSDDDLSTVLGAVRCGAFDYVVKSDLGPLLASIERAASHYRLVMRTNQLERAAAATVIPGVPAHLVEEEIGEPLSDLVRRCQQLGMVARRANAEQLASSFEHLGDELLVLVKRCQSLADRGR